MIYYSHPFGIYNTICKFNQFLLQHKYLQCGLQVPTSKEKGLRSFSKLENENKVVSENNNRKVEKYIHN